MKKQIYTILIGGSDCDGLFKNQDIFEVFYSKKVAEIISTKQNDSSDGLIYSVIPINELYKYLEDTDINFYDYKIFFLTL